MTTPVATLSLALITALLAGPSTLAHSAPAHAISGSDPTGDVAVDGDLEPLLGSSEVYDAADLTSVSGDVSSTAYTVQATTVGALTGGSDVLFLTTEVSYDFSWSTVTRRGRVAEIPEGVRLTVTAEGTTVDRVSLPPRCRNDEGFSAAADGARITITVPRACAKGTSGVPLGIADIRVTSDGFGPGGTFASSYSDEASVTGIARLATGAR